MTVAAQSEWPTTLLVAARLVSIAVIGAVLYFAQPVLIPIALAVLVTFLMAPLVTRLDRWGLPRILAVIIVAGSVTGLIGGFGYVIVGEMSDLAQELPAYRENIRSKLADLRAMTRSGTLGRVQRAIADVSEEVERDVSAEEAAEDEAGPTAPAEEPNEPMRVQVEPEEPLLSEPALLNSVLGVAATMGLTMLLSIFMLLQREDLRNRMVAMAGPTSLAVTTKALAEAAERITRYLLMQFILNASMGFAVGLGLFFVGVPYAALWGLSAAVLRYIPYVGPWMAAVLPILVSLVTAPGWEQVALVMGLFVTLELLSNNVMEPWLYGQSIGLTPVAVILSAVFWTWLWGPVGLVLATPITACIVVLARYIPGLSVLGRLLSDEPPLQPHQGLYQRLLARDDDDAEHIVEQDRSAHSLIETCDELLLGALLMLKLDLTAGRITPEDGAYIAKALREIIGGLSVDVIQEAQASPRPEGAPVRLIGFPVHDELDEIALQLFGITLKEENCEFDILSPDRPIGERVLDLEARTPAAVCMLALLPGDLTTILHACKRLCVRLPGLNVLVARLGESTESERSDQQLRAAGARHVASTLKELSSVCRQLAREAQAPVNAAPRDALADSAGKEDPASVMAVPLSPDPA
jgi:predicted PurR-regulated permease PerM